MNTATPAVLTDWLSLALATALPAQDEGRQPDRMLDQIDPLMVRVRVEFIEVSRDQLDDLMFGAEAPASDGELRRQVGRLVSQGKASLVETQMAMSRPGTKATTESVREFIYPTEFEPPEAPGEVRCDARDGQPVPKPRDFAAGPTPSAWDTRKLGSTLEIEPGFGLAEGTVNLRLLSELTYFVRNDIWSEWTDRRGTAHVQMPIIYTARCNTTVHTEAGKYLMAAALSPKGPDGAADPSRKLMVFVKCDILFAPPPSPEAARRAAAEVAVMRADAEAEEADPKADPFASDGAASPPGPSRIVRTRVEFIEVPHATFTALIAGEQTIANDDAIRVQAGQLIAKGEARLLESMLAVCPSGEKLRTQSIREFIYPTEYEPAEVPSIVRLAAADLIEKQHLPDLATGATPSAWDTRNLGSTLELESSITDFGRSVFLEFTPEIVSHSGNQIWVGWKGRHGRANIEMPDFYTLRCTGSVMIPAGRFLMVAALDPRDAAGVTDPSRKVMVFVKCDILDTGK